VQSNVEPGERRVPPERESRELRRLVEAIPDGLLVFDDAGLVSYANRRVEQLLGHASHALVGRPAGRLFADGSDDVATLRRRARADEPEPLELLGERADGRTVPLSVTCSTVSDERPRQYAVALRKRRDRPGSGSRSRELEHYEAIVQTVDDGIYTLDADSRFTAVNDAFVELTGYDRADLLGSHLSTVTTAAAVEASDRQRERLVAGERDVVTTETVLRTADGKIVPIENSFTLLPTDDGFEGTTGVVRDLRERKARAADLRLKEQALDETGIGIVIADATDPELPIIHANKGFERIAGYAAEEVLGENCRTLQGDGTDDEAVAELRAALAERRPTTVELLNYRKDGTPFWNKVDVAPVRDETGAITHFIGFQTDVTERKERELELERYETIIETVDDGIYVMDDQHRLLAVNEAFADLLGYDRERLVGAHMSLFTSQREIARSLVQRQSLVEGDADVMTTETEIRTASGRSVPIESRFSLLPSDDGTFEGTVGVVRDVTERTARERKLSDHRDALATLNDINALVQEVIRAMVHAASRDELERTVCERLTDSEFYEVAWVAEREMAGEGLALRSIVGGDRALRELISSQYGGRERDGPAAKAMREQDVVVIDRPGDYPDVSKDVMDEALSNGVRSGIAVPLRYGRTVYGVFVVLATRPGAFGERELAAFRTLGDVVGFAINAVRNRHLLFADAVVELEFAIHGGTALTALTEDLDCTCTLEGVVPTRDHHLVYVTVADAAPDLAAARLERADTVSSVRVVDRSADDCRLEVAVTTSPIQTLVDAGATVRTATVADGEERLLAEISPEASVRDVVETVQLTHPDTEFVGKREVDRSVYTPREFRRRVDDVLTDRQWTALETARLAGYFEWPRESTAEELATSMGISSPTLHQHLRAAERKLFEAFFESR